MENTLQLKILIAVMSVVGTVLYVFVTYRFLLRRRYEGYRSDVIRRLFPVAIAAFAGTVTIVTFIWTRDRERDLSDRLLQPSSSFVGLTARIDHLENELRALRESSQSLPPDTTGVAPTSQDLADLRHAVHTNQQAIEKFEQLFLTDAERLITLPLLERDLTAIRDDLTLTKESVSGISKLVTETNGQNRWVIGTLALGMLALVVPAVRSLFASGGKEDPEKNKNAG